MGGPCMQLLLSCIIMIIIMIVCNRKGRGYKGEGAGLDTLGLGAGLISMRGGWG